MTQKQILLATYNGGKYLPEQLQSLLEQTDKDWTLLVRDDGSSDRTPQILQIFAEEHPDKIKIMHDHNDGRSNNNIGPVRNFARLLKESTAPYVMFCDQDDVWYPEKIAKSMGKMHEMERKYGSKEPILVHTDYNITDSTRNNKAAPRKHPSARFTDLLVQNTVSGFSITMNRALVKEIQPIPETIYHDSWAGVIASLNGHIGYVDSKLADYRRHDSNVTGAPYLGENETFSQKVRRKWNQGIKNTVGAMVEENSAYYRAKGNLSNVLMREHGHDMGQPEYDAAKALVNLPNQGYFRQRVDMVKHGLLPNNRLGEKIQRAVLPIRPKDNRTWKQTIEDAPETNGILSEPLCNVRTGSLLSLLRDNINEEYGSNYLKMLRVKTTELYKQHEQESGLSHIKDDGIDGKIDDILITAMKKFVQNAHSPENKGTATSWDNVSCGKDIKGVYNELLNEFILPEVKAHFARKPDGKTEQAGRTI